MERGAPPQAGQMCVPQDGPPVVEAERTERLADQWIALVMAGETRDGRAVGARAASPGSTRPGGTAAGAHRAAVHGPERRRSKGDEELGVFDHLRAHSLAAPDAGGHQLPGVSLVEARTRGADGGPAVLARNEELTLGQLSGSPVQRDAAQPDRVRAQTGLIDFGEDGSPPRRFAHRWPRTVSARLAMTPMAQSSRKWVRILTGTAPSARSQPTPRIVGSRVDAE